MNSHLAVKIKGKFLALAPDTSIDIEDINPYFNDVTESYSYSFQVPLKDNREIFGNVDDVLSDARLVEHENDEMVIFVEGIPMRSGKVATTENQDIKDNISVAYTSNVRSLSDYFNDLKCQDIPVKDKIQIGEILGNIYADYSATLTLKTKSSGKKGFLSWSSTKTASAQGTGSGHLSVELPALGFSTPGICEDLNASSPNGNHLANGSYNKDTGLGKAPTYLKKFVNVTAAYGELNNAGVPATYCNARVCYMHYKKKDDGTSSDVPDRGIDYKYNPYYLLEADRPQSGICFYILYFLDCLFDHLNMYGITYDNSALMAVTDMKRLCFFTTHCKFDIERKYPSKDQDDFDLGSEDEINNWLSSRCTGGQLKMEWEKTKNVGGMKYEGRWYQIGDKLPNGEEVKSANIEMSNVQTFLKANIMNMYANSKNFPNESVQTIIDSLWASFGIRFYLNQETMEVKPVFIRDVLRDSSTPITFHAEVITAVKVAEKITGFRMKYSAESDKREQNANIVNGVRDYDTDYDYKDYRRINDSETYGTIIKHCGISDMTLYVDRTTGNKYRLKVDGEAETAADYHPVIFEVGQFKGVEIGDCSDEMEDFVEEVSSSFQPVSFNDVNGQNEKHAGTDNATVWQSNQDSSRITLSSLNATDKEQVLTAFIDEDMWHEYSERSVRTALGDDYSIVYVKETCRTQEAFDPSNSDEGTSPLQEKDWGLAIAVMRGGGSDATIQYYDYDYDGFGNSKWRMVPGLYGMSSDSIDCWGAHYDYNGTMEGIGPEDRISLKIRAYIEDPETGEILCNPDVARRGLFDQFMSDYAYFLLNRKVVKLEVKCEPAELLNIQWASRYNIGGYVGWINKISSRITAENGLEKVTIEMYVL